MKRKSSLLRAAAGRQQPDANLHEPDVEFRARLDPRRVQDELRATASVIPLGATTTGKGAVRNRATVSWKRRTSRVECVPVARVHFGQHLHQVRAGGKCVRDLRCRRRAR